MPKTDFKNFEDYFRLYPKEVQNILQKIRDTIKRSAPEATETIAYQMPTFKLKGKNLVHFAAYKNHIGFYPTPPGTENFAEELSAYKTSKGTAQFQLDGKIPYELIAKIVKFRVDELDSKKSGY